MGNSLETEYLKHSRRFLKYLDLCRGDLNERNIHQLRTSLKRQLTFVRFHSYLEEQEEALSAEKNAIVGIYKTAGAIREMQLHQNLCQLLLSTPDVAYENLLMQEENFYREALKHELADFDEPAYRQLISERAQNMASASEAMLLQKARTFVGQKAEKVKQILDSRTDSECYHACRKHLKQMGFVVFYLDNAHQFPFSPAFPEQFKKIDLLIGYWHDCELFKNSYSNYVRALAQTASKISGLHVTRKIQRANNKRLAALHRELALLLPELIQPNE